MDTHVDGHHNLRKWRVTLRSAIYFITAATACRRQLFLDPGNARIVADAMQGFHDRGYVHGFAWVVMPDNSTSVVTIRMLAVKPDMMAAKEAL